MLTRTDEISESLDQAFRKMVEWSQSRGLIHQRVWFGALLTLALKALYVPRFDEPWESLAEDVRQGWRAKLLRSLQASVDRKEDAWAADRLEDFLREVDNETLAQWVDLSAEAKTPGNAKERPLFGKWLGERLDDQNAWTRYVAAGSVIAPRSLAELAAKIADVHPADSVTDFSCGPGGFIAAAYQQAAAHADAFRAGTGPIHGIALDGLTGAFAWLRLRLLGCQQIHIEIGLDRLLTLTDPVDVILSAPPVGLGFAARDPNIGSSTGASAKRTGYDLVAVERALSLLKPQTGRGVFLLPQGLLFQDGERRALRRRLLDEGRLRAVIALPTGLLAPVTGIKTALVVIGPTQGRSDSSVMMVDAAMIGHQDGKQRVISPAESLALLSALHQENWSTGPVRSRRVSVEEIAQLEFDLQPSRYLSDAPNDAAVSTDVLRARVVELDKEYQSIAPKFDELVNRLSPASASNGSTRR